MFRFTIRNVLWMMVVVALMAGWLAEHRRALKAEQDQERVARYRNAVIEMGQFLHKKTGEPVRIVLLEEVLDL